MENLKMPGGLLVGIPFTRLVAPEFMMSLVTQSYPIGTNLVFFTATGVEVGDARNAIIEKALESGSRYVWFVDDDTAPPNFAVRKLIYQLEQNGPPYGKAMVCAGIYCTKEEPASPTVFTGEMGNGCHWGWKAMNAETGEEGDVFECTGIATGCMMIRTELFKHIEKPWFKTEDKEPTDSKVFREQRTDDLYFCEKVLKAGYKILAHGGVLPVHWETKDGFEFRRPFVLPKDCYPLKPREKKTEPLSIEDWSKNLDGEEAKVG
jgi:GT2 family glycosyltransferase